MLIVLAVLLPLFGGSIHLYLRTRPNVTAANPKVLRSFDFVVIAGFIAAITRIGFYFNHYAAGSGNDASKWIVLLAVILGAASFILLTAVLIRAILFRKSAHTERA